MKVEGLPVVGKLTMHVHLILNKLILTVILKRWQFLCVSGMYISYRVEVPNTLYSKEY